ncbi:MAG: hypothetical protein IIZ14_03360, partial [Solobacterium sp.]|nr:hypothetical protein [Solobacterium sp.]
MKMIVNETEQPVNAARNRIHAKRRAASVRAEAADIEKAVAASLKRRSYRMMKLAGKKETAEPIMEETVEIQAVPAAKTVVDISAYRSDAAGRELKTLEELKENFREYYLNEGVIYQKDILSALEHLELSDEEMENLYVWFDDEEINISEDEDVEEMND